MPQRSSDLSLPVLQPRRRAVSHASALADHDAKEKCGVFGVWGRPDAVELSYLGLFAQQHRGQESAGIAVLHDEGIDSVVGMGLVSEVFGEREIDRLNKRPVRGAIGHNRYSTSGGSLACNTQPLVERFHGGHVAVGHNGNLINAALLRERFERQGHLFHTTSDTEVIIHLLASPTQQDLASVGRHEPMRATLRRLQGAFSLVFLFEDRIEAARDPWGWRPLVLGRMPTGEPVVASETVALHVVGAEFLREVEPGEIVRLSDAGIESDRFAEPAERPAYCIFEHVYFASPASDIFGQNVQRVRESLGAKLAEEAPVDADWIVPMPDSGRSAANGFARASGLPYREAIVPNRYVGRTFIKPTPEQRRRAVRLKLNVISELVDGKRLVIVDDSIVRGTTTREKMRQIRAAGASEIHLRISCPPIRHPCYFGVDFATRDQLIANERTVEEIREYLGVDSLAYLSLEGLLSCASHPNEHYCTACYSGDYRLDIDHPIAEGVVTEEQLRMFG